MSSPTLESLANDIAKSAAVLTDALRKQNVPQPSFAVDGPPRFPQEVGPDMLAVRSQLVYAARQLQFLALGPTESLQWFALAGAIDTATLRWLFHFNIASHVPKTGTISFSDLAQASQTSQRTLTRIVRHAATNNIFHEASPSQVAHTSLSLRLAEESNPIRGVVGHQTETVFPAVSRMVEAHDKYGTHDETTTHAPFNEAFGTDMRALDWVAQDPVRSARFAESMKGNASSGPFSNVHTVKGFDWVSLGKAAVVDVGGSAGQVSKAIAASAPDLRFIVQDQASMVAKGQAELELDLKPRLDFQTHDFFQPNPISEPDVFFLRLILHDWPDKDALTILRQLVDQMGEKTRIVINDAVMPAPGQVHPLQEKYVRNVDMIMMSMFNGLERTREDWDTLLTEAGLRIVKVVQPFGSALAVIEAVKSPRRS